MSAAIEPSVRLRVCAALRATLPQAALLIDAYGLDGNVPATLRTLAARSGASTHATGNQLAQLLRVAASVLEPVRADLRGLLSAIHARTPADLADVQASLDLLDGWDIASLLRFAAEVMVEAPPVRIERERRGETRVPVLWPRDLPEWTLQALRIARDASVLTGAACVDSIARALRTSCQGAVGGDTVATALARLPRWIALDGRWGVHRDSRNRPLQAMLAVLSAAREPLPFATLYTAAMRVAPSLRPPLDASFDPLAPPHVLRALLDQQQPDVQIVAGGGYQLRHAPALRDQTVEGAICQAITDAGGLISRTHLQRALPHIGGAVLNASLYSSVRISPVARGYYAVRGGLLEPDRLAQSLEDSNLYQLPAQADSVRGSIEGRA